MPWRPGLPLLAVALLLAGCATPSTRTEHAPTPAACTDSLYVQLARQHPDSLSERAWLRLQTLDSACIRARTHTANDTGGMGMMGMMGMGQGHGKVWTVLAPVIVASMAVMMVVLRF